ncbi:SPOR domain-containing protein [Microbacterium sp. BWT-B31]|uniref:SPOR domain-containing protein n=1 Tax=Microbacterium sp. BWT-B31 TaxID=3232072 RepID=UPI0035274DB8
MAGDEEKYWYVFATGKVERGFESPAIDRAGPFDTPEEAANAPQLLKERSKAWAEEDARDDDWGSAESAGTPGADH